MPTSIPPEIPATTRILALNGGSSSLKFALFAAEARFRRVASGSVERIGLEGSSLKTTSSSGDHQEEKIEAPDHGAAIAAVLNRLGPGPIAAIGHRVVHGGAKFFDPERITPEVIAELKQISPFDPDHLPGEIAVIEAMARVHPDVPQVACFDTAFHRDMPRVSKILPIPRKYEAQGVHRYGFHGISYAFLMQELANLDAAGGRVVLAHLGNGASLAAVKDGKSVDTTMGFTPTAGLVMGTRTGDLDPGLVGFLARRDGLSIDDFHDMVNRQSGLLGVSETSSDVRDLLSRRASDLRAAEAIDLFCHSARKQIAGMAASLGGVDTLVFSGGIGENSAEVRSQICDGLGFLGMVLDEARNTASAGVISADDAKVVVRVIRTDEEIMIARDVAKLLEIA